MSNFLYFVFFFIALMFSTNSVDVEIQIILVELEIWNRLGRSVLRNFSMLKKSLLFPRFLVISDSCGIDELVLFCTTLCI